MLAHVLAVGNALSLLNERVSFILKPPGGISSAPVKKLRASFRSTKPIIMSHENKIMYAYYSKHGEPLFTTHLLPCTVQSLLLALCDLVIRPHTGTNFLFLPYILFCRSSFRELRVK